MEAPPTKVVLRAVLALVVLGWAAVRTPAEEAAHPQAALTERVEKQISDIETRMAELQEQEFEVTMKIMQAQQKANEGVDDPGKAPEKLAKGEGGKGLREYKLIMMSCAQQVQAFDGRLFPVMKSVQGLQRDREKAPAELKARIDAVASRVEGKHRSNLEKAASFYEQAAEFRSALGLYVKILQSMPEQERLKDAGLTEKIANLYDKIGDKRNALALYLTLWERKNEKDRYKDRKLGEKVAGLCADVGDLKTALTIYQGLYDAIPKDKQEKDGKGIMDRIKDIEKKTGRPSRN